MNNSPQIQTGTGFTLRPPAVSYCHSINIRKTGKTRLPDFQLHSGFAKVFRHCGAEALGVRTLELFKGGGCPPYPVSLRPPHLPSQVCAKHSTKRATDKGKLATLTLVGGSFFVLFMLAPEMASRCGEKVASDSQGRRRKNGLYLIKNPLRRFPEGIEVIKSQPLNKLHLVQ